MKDKLNFLQVEEFDGFNSWCSTVEAPTASFRRTLQTNFQRSPWCLTWKKNIASNEKITTVEMCTKPKLGKGFHQNTGAISSFQDMFGQQQWSPQVW